LSGSAGIDTLKALKKKKPQKGSRVYFWPEVGMNGFETDGWLGCMAKIMRRHIRKMWTMEVAQIQRSFQYL
jgi:hypothetical protein